MNSKVAENRTAVEYADGILALTRHFNAPRERVFDAWTRKEHFARWFGPRGATMPHCAIDLRVGGEMHFCVQEPGGARVWCKWIFRELQRPERLVLADYFADEQGNIVERPGFPRETIITVNFAARGNRTEVTVRHALPVDHGEIAGWREGFERLDALLNQLTAG